MRDLSKPVLVAGASVGGLTAALAMRRHGIPVRVYERRSLAEVTEATGFGHTIWSNATTALATLGLGDRLREVGELLELSESRNSRQEVVFRMEMAQCLTPGAMPALGISRGDLIGTLREACLAHGAELHYSRPLASYRETGDGVEVAFADGTTATGAGLIGADGIRSTVLAQLHGSLPIVDSGRSTYRGVATDTCGMRRNVVHLFSDPDSRIGGGAWLVGGDRVVWTLSCERAPDGEDPQGTSARAAELAQVLGELPECFVAATPPEKVTRTHVFYHRWLDSWGRGPVTVLGDAAHTFPTDLGQGACMAIEDGVVLGDALAVADDLRAGLRAYEQRRRPRVEWVRSRVMRVNGFKPIKNPAARWAVTKVARVVIAASAPKMWREIQRPLDLLAQQPTAEAA